MDAFVAFAATTMDGSAIVREFSRRLTAAQRFLAVALVLVLVFTLDTKYLLQEARADGMRRSLAEAGLEFSAGYTGDVLGNVSGGTKRGSHYIGLVEVAVDIDLEKLVGVRGLSFYASGFQIHGTSISAENVGGLASVSNIEAFPSTRLFEAWFEQNFANDKVSIRVGQIAADAEFFVADGGGNFINSTFGWTTISSGSIPVGGPIYPIATPGIRLAVQPTDRLKLAAGIWNGDPVGPCNEDLDPGQCNTDGFAFRLQDPPLAIVEAAYSHNGIDAGLPGKIKVGAWRHFGDFDDVRRDTSGGFYGVTNSDPLQHKGNNGVYAVVEQLIYRLPGEDDRNISVFARAAISQSDRNEIDSYIDGGIIFTGPLAWRPNDTLGIAAAYSGISDAAAAFDRDSGLPFARSHEVILEASYTAAIYDGLIVVPDFQYFWNPGGRIPDASGNRALKNAAVLGLRTVVSY